MDDSRKKREERAEDEELRAALLLADYVDRAAESDAGSSQFLAEHSGASRELAGELQTFDEIAATVEDDEETPPATKFGDFEIVREIGHGGMGVVYEARQLALGRPVALKVLAAGRLAGKKSLERFRREPMAAARLHHPLIVGVFAGGMENGQPYFAMELVEGETLDNVLRRLHGGGGPGPRPELPGSESRAAERFAALNDVFAGVGGTATTRPAAAAKARVTEIELRPEVRTDLDALHRSACLRLAEAFAGVADALHHAHERDVIHRDIKPSNLIVDRSGRLRVLDFGLAFVHEEENLTVTEGAVGTVPYMSPEQVETTPEFRKRGTDIYSVGATLYETLTGRPPFRGRDVRGQILRRDPLALRRLNSRVPRDLETIVLKCLRKSPGERYRTAEALAQDLRRLVRGDPIEARPQTLPARAARRVWRSRRPIAVQLAVAAVLAPLAWLFVFEPFRERERQREAEFAALVQGGSLQLHEPRFLTAPAIAERAELERQVLCPAPEGDLSARDGSSLADRLDEARHSVSEAGPAIVEAGPDRLAEAEARLRRAVELFGDRPLARYHLARVLYRRNDLEGAVDQLRAALANDRGFFLARGLLVWIEEQRAAAVPGVKRRARSDPRAIERLAAEAGSDWQAAWLRGQRAALEGDWVAAAAALDGLQPAASEIRRRYPGLWQEALLERGRARLNADRPVDALQDFTALATLGQDLPPPLRLEPALLAGRALHVQGLPESAVELFGEALRAVSGDEALRTRAIGEVAGTYREVGDSSRALEWAGLLPPGAERERLQADLFERAGKKAEALQSARKAADLDGGTVASLLTLAQVLLDQGDIHGAEERCRAAAARDPKDPRPLLTLAACLEAEGDTAEAMAQVRAAIPLDPHLGAAHFDLGRLLELAGRSDEAAESYRRAIDLDPGGALALNNLGVVLDLQGHLEEAERTYRRSVRAAPRFGRGHYNLAWALQRLLKFPEAEEEYRRALEHGLDGSPAAHLNRGICLHYLRRYDDAIEEYGRALRFAPRSALAHQCRAVAQEHKAYYQRSLPGERCRTGYLRYLLEDTVADLWRATALAPDWAEAGSQLGWALDRLDRVDEASAEYLRTIEIDPADIWPYNNLARFVLRAEPADLPWGGGAMAILRLEGAARLPSASPAIDWLLERLRRRALPDLPTFSTIDRWVDGPADLIPEDAEWRHLPGVAPPPADWKSLEYDDSSWGRGKAPLGFPREAGIATVLDDLPGSATTLYLRRRFTVEKPRVASLRLSARFDNGFVAYLNGKEIGRVRAGEEGREPAWDDVASEGEELVWEAAELPIDLDDVRDGENVLAILALDRGKDDPIFAIGPVLRATPVHDERWRERMAEMLRAFREAASGDDAAARVAYLEARLDEERDPAAAELELREVCASSGGRPEPLLRLARSLAARGQPAAAEELLRGALVSHELPGDRLGDERLGDERLGDERLRDEWLRLSWTDLAASPADVLAALARLPAGGDPPPGSSEGAPLRGRRRIEERREDLRSLLETLSAHRTVRIHAGGGAIEGAGRDWMRDGFFLGGLAQYNRLEGPAAGHPSSAVYRTQREFPEAGPRLAAYRIPVPPGAYSVTLHFVELRKDPPRRFDVLLEGKRVLESHEPLREGFSRPHSRRIDRVEVNDGALDIEFVARSGHPALSGIEIEPLEASAAAPRVRRTAAAASSGD